MSSNNKIIHLFNLFLLLIAIHSFLVGLGLIFLPGDILEIFGFQEIINKFFPVQGGVFHLIMAVIYIFAIKRKELQYFLIPLIVGIKLFAAFFLVLFYFIKDPVITILLSGIGDGLMGIILYVFYNQLKKKGLLTSIV